MNRSITVIKRVLSGKEVLRWEGTVLRQESDVIFLEAYFNHADMPVVDTYLERGDRFVETYYTDRWYNFSEIHAREDGWIKGWYCNVAKPAVLEAEDTLSYVDLALDLWVSRDGTQTVLDEDEFAALPIDDGTRSRGRAALQELKELFKPVEKT